MIPFFKYVPVRIFLLVCLYMAMVSPETYAQHPSFGIRKEGKGKAVILIPGLYCSGEVWDRTVAQYRDHYTCYALTLPGFAGQPPIKADSMLTTITRELAGFIRDNKLEKPIIVGHSLGGWVALQLGTLYPDLPGKLVVVSSGPFLPAFAMGPDATPQQTREIAATMQKSMATLTPEQIRTNQLMILPSLITDSINRVPVTQMAMRSHSPTQAQVMYELYTLDLRQQLNLITCPILVLADWIGYKNYGVSRDMVLGNYRTQYQKAPQAVISMSDEARHFIMTDQPEWFFNQVDTFLQR
ncbi:Pimeloyl-ACP methyl ester carboxylesterase [Chitinophaga eiseniae]|uniref:Pimeloyl-ACP methyl ester carboxylesterase n=1 Tax=Chitinophaga eiseniae TaxID=634771 RepID=A0A1T4SZ09_9BACT|nr:alpha/beta hydrolase [Chitinophaga eiseniae]SKA33470.1 Pimeloyl-ACP methyl ester carboxylesterase [Chitinophaga eiseniae]